MVEVFISYVREDADYVDYLKSLLEANGIQVWLDRERLIPGLRWKDAIRRAIQNGAYFLSVHSNNRASRPVSYANEELVLAIDELRKRSYGSSWLIPIRIDDSEMEARPIGAGETLLDLNYCDLTNWVPELKKLFSVLGVGNPVLDFGEPLAPGLTSTVVISSGVLRYEILPGLPEMMQGMEFRIAGGWCQRLEDGTILANIETVAPFRHLQEANQSHGLSSVLAHTSEQFISTDSRFPTAFSSQREYTLPKGIETYDYNTQQRVKFPFDIRFRTGFVARGALDSRIFSGSFDSVIQSISPEVPFRQVQRGDFSMEFRPVVRTPS